MKARNFGILSAATASVCCLGPIVLILLGLGGLGLGAAIGKYHWYFIIGAALLLVLGWRVYFKESRACKSRHCEMEGRGMTRNVLALASLVVLTFAGLNLYTYAKGGSVEELSEKGTRLSIPVEGMTCFACETTVQTAVSKLPGIYEVKASARDKVALVSYDPEKTSLDQIVETINNTGYKASKPEL